MAFAHRKILSDEERAAITERSGAKPGSVCSSFRRMSSNAPMRSFRACESTSAKSWVERMVASGTHSSSWTFPLFEKDEGGKLGYVHQPFVAPLEEDIPLLETDPEKVRGTHYDVIMNGTELGSGSLRNHRADIQRRILELMGYSSEETEKSFRLHARCPRGGSSSPWRVCLRFRPHGDGAREGGEPA